MNQEESKKLLELLKRLETVCSREDYEVCAECGNINNGSNNWHRCDCELKRFIDILCDEKQITFSEKKFSVDIEKIEFKPFQFPKIQHFDPLVTYFLPADTKMIFCAYCGLKRVDHLKGEECPTKGNTLYGPTPQGNPL